MTTKRITATEEILTAAAENGWAPSWPISGTLKLVRDEAVLHVYTARNGSISCVRESLLSVPARYKDLPTPRRTAALMRISRDY
ncbi:hypothetical protein [Aeromicrobium sp.]|uniref:hypothetical protein n=1 Tax=Aeromicrobium sp. TaxID=1871063 RepID=UPI0019AF3E93|nr:hypothetical protein [Aeromicrobium sp.]MBC7630318.1 hypothetical protein [Aeromicrobium sp.]